MKRTIIVLCGAAIALVTLLTLCALYNYRARCRADPLAKLIFIGAAVREYESDHGHWPASLSDLIESNAAPWGAPYIRGKLPADPWGQPLYYTVLGSNLCEVRSAGRDGIRGTPDDQFKRITQAGPRDGEPAAREP